MTRTPLFEQFFSSSNLPSSERSTKLSHAFITKGPPQIAHTSMLFVVFTLMHHRQKEAQPHPTSSVPLSWLGKESATTSPSYKNSTTHPSAALIRSLTGYLVTSTLLRNYNKSIFFMMSLLTLPLNTHQSASPFFDNTSHHTKAGYQSSTTSSKTA